MHTSIVDLIKRGLSTMALKSYGWKRRKRRESVSYRIEWRDPVTGHWYAEKTALRILKGSVLAEYDKPNRSKGNFRF